MEFGTVTFFDGRDDKRYGFIRADRDGAKIFFHLNNELMILSACDGGAEPVWIKPDFEFIGIPRKSERIIFEREDSSKGPKAAKWSKDYSVESMVHPERDTPAYLHAALLRMTVEWDILEITFTNHQFDTNTLFGDTAARIRALAHLNGFGFYSFAEDPEGDDYRNYRRGTLGEKRTFKFKIYYGVDHMRLVDLSIGRGIIEDVKYDDLTRIRHARHWKLPDTASLEDIVRARDEYIDERV